MVLSLLLVSTQISAAICSVRCEGMRVSTHGSMPGMAHCHSMPPDHVVSSGTATVALHDCSSRVCQSDLTFLLNRSDSTGKLPILPVTMAISADAPAVASSKSEAFFRYHTSRSPSPTHPFDPLISSLRI